ncbi:MAG: HIT family protein [Ktedonobacterales bacterium]|nr:HIT family protein [Ktedonobacterales bacterium]
MRQSVPGTPASGCPFCQRETLAVILEETPHFFLLADHAPLAEGHLLLVPHAHYACYGAVPAALDDELPRLKERIAVFLTTTYGPFIFFEHGVFRQTVPHAHLHAIPIGSADFSLRGLAGMYGQPVRSLADVRAWYAERGHYFYLEQPAHGARPAQATIFPPELDHYQHVLGMVRRAARHREEWLPQPVRRAIGSPKMRSLAEAWCASSAADPPARP